MLRIALAVTPYSFFLDEKVRIERLRTREIERKSQFLANENGENTYDFLEWCKTYLTTDDKDITGTYAEHAHQMEISKSPVLKLDSSLSAEELYAEILSL